MLAHLTRVILHEDVLTDDDSKSVISSEKVLFCLQENILVENIFLQSAIMIIENRSWWLQRVHKNVMTTFKTAEVLL